MKATGSPKLPGPWNSLAKPAFLALACLLLAGCVTYDASDSTDPKPWNSPAGWEDSVMGVPI